MRVEGLRPPPKSCPRGWDDLGGWIFWRRPDFVRCFFVVGKKSWTEKHTLPETNSLPLKMDGWNTSFLLGRPIFRGYVSFREGSYSTISKLFFEVYELFDNLITPFYRTCYF